MVVVASRERNFENDKWQQYYILLHDFFRMLRLLTECICLHIIRRLKWLASLQSKLYIDIDINNSQHTIVIVIIVQWRFIKNIRIGMKLWSSFDAHFEITQFFRRRKWVQCALYSQWGTLAVDNHSLKYTVKNVNFASLLPPFFRRISIYCWCCTVSSNTVTSVLCTFLRFKICHTTPNTERWIEKWNKNKSKRNQLL